MKLVHVSVYKTEKCWRCPAYNVMARETNGCLIKLHERREPIKCKDGTCNLKKLRQKEKEGAE